MNNQPVDLEGMKVLIVDDTTANIDVLRKTLAPQQFEIAIALNGEAALKLAPKFLPDLILLDIRMPGIDGYETCRQLKENAITQKAPVIFISANSDTQDIVEGFHVGGVDYITKPFRAEEVLARIRSHLELSALRNTLEEKVLQRTDLLNKSRLEILQRLVKTSEFKDNETGMHIRRMSRYSTLLGKAHGLNEEKCELLLNASPMHDLGKVGIPDRILLKPGKLDHEEMEIMKTHTTIGGEILAGGTSELLQMAETIALTHQEKWDGSGYPKGLTGEEIPLEGRITALADVFDALTSERPYKKAWSVEKAVNLIEEESGKHFDPELAALFIKILPEILQVKERFKEPGKETDTEDFVFTPTLKEVAHDNLG
ncbi:Response regulator [hydrothermal vent metagenome]|uniref:Response regulator n=1 Tax=hydrothermal vent metagenome TaxID=652676 RepID=A0A3B1CN30_9ZZZZ